MPLFMVHVLDQQHDLRTNFKLFVIRDPLSNFLSGHRELWTKNYSKETIACNKVDKTW